MNAHPVADLFPMMGDEEFRALVEDIRAHGQLEPVWMVDGQILDGRNRWRACREIGIEPITRIYVGTTDTPTLVNFVVSLNLKRRHLNSSQRAVLALEIEKVLAEAAQQKELERKTTFQKFEKSDLQPLHAAEQAAQITGTNRQYVSDAKRIAAQAPDLLESVRSGEMSITEAKQEARQREKEQAKQERLASPPLALPDMCQVEHGSDTKHVRGNSIDAIITDPPYGISHYGGVTKVGNELVTADFDGESDWDSTNPEEFLDRLYDWAEEWERLLKPGGSVIAFTDRVLISHLWDTLKRVDLRPKQVIVWAKTNPSPAGLARKNLISATEFMVWAVKPGAPYAFNEVDGWDRRNVIVTPIIGGHEKADHPTQKPLSVMSNLIALTTKPGDLVLDPFAGSGSTGVAALRLGRRAHLIDSDLNYVRMAERRLAEISQELAA